MKFVLQVEIDYKSSYGDENGFGTQSFFFNQRSITKEQFVDRIKNLINEYKNEYGECDLDYLDNIIKAAESVKEWPSLYSSCIKRSAQVFPNNVYDKKYWITMDWREVLEI